MWDVVPTAVIRAQLVALYLHCSYSVNMGALRFEWDEGKNRSNQRKHGVPFAEARTAFFDDYARVLPDPDHSDDQERFVLLGLSVSLRLLVVCHCHRESEEVIRIFSARKANRNEITQYQRWMP